ncbi:MAG: methyltransferase domain-containing protein [Gemmatimonadetes bacterium]|nr:methyltransferase domain-containing protein [Gemmatimonadota bacterium]
MPDVLDPTAYRRWFESPLGLRVWADERRALTRVRGDLSGCRVVDAGAGDGRFAAEISGEGASVVAVDRSRSMLSAARARAVASNDRRVHLVQADAARLPLTSNSCDAAVAITLLCVANDPPAILAELTRVARPGGLVVVGELGRWSTWAASRRVRGWWRCGLWSSARFWTVPKLRALIRRSGLQPGARSAAVFYPPWTPLAILLGPFDRFLGRLTSIGAAFIAVASRKPVTISAAEATGAQSRRVGRAT